MQLTTTTQNNVTLTQEKLDLLNKTICKDLTKDEIILFSEVCASKQLDPFSNQIYAIKRGGRLTFQVGIDGLRSIAEKTGEYDGQEDPVWYDHDGNQFYIWLKKEAPAACRVGIYRKGISRPFRAIVNHAEFCSSVNPLWRTMPAHLLSKCAEAAAIRKAFPQIAGGLYEKDEPHNDEKSEAKRKVDNINEAILSEPPVIPVQAAVVEEKKRPIKVLLEAFDRATANMTLAEKKEFLKEHFEVDTFQAFSKMPDDIVLAFADHCETLINKEV